MNEMTPPEVGRREVAERLQQGNTFLITAHRNPDGDALGSSIALGRIAEKMGKRAAIVVRDGFFGGDCCIRGLHGTDLSQNGMAASSAGLGFFRRGDPPPRAGDAFEDSGDIFARHGRQLPLRRYRR